MNREGNKIQVMNGERSKPREFLESCLGDTVEVALKNGDLIRGMLKSFDDYLNLKLVDARRPESTGVERFKALVVRGSNVVFVSPSRT